MWFKKALDSVFEIVKEPLTEWQKRKTLKVENEAKELERKHDLRVKRLEVATELAKQGKQVEANWDARAQEQMNYGWKDEWFVFLFSIPLIGAFIPSSREYVLAGFETLEKCPDWYMWLLVGIVSATFGLRWMFGKIKLR